MQIGCPAQVLVVDRANGFANILVGLFEQVVVVSRDNDAALKDYEFDLIVVSLETIQTNQFALLHNLRAEYVDIPILLIGHSLSHAGLEYCRQLEVREVIEMPRRAAELKSAVFAIAQRYLQCM